MSKRLNKKGMTLVEIVIVLLIASIAMTITGGILINSLGYFQDTTELSTDKTAGDGILDFIKSEIQYSTYVCVDKDHPTDMTGDWHNLYVDGDLLYKDDSPVWGDTDKKGDYYNNRNLNIKAKGFNNGYRLDMVISLNTGSGTQVDTKYKVSHTFEFLNLKRQKAANASFENPLANVVNKNEELSSNMKLWYIKDTDAINPDKDDGGDTDSTGDGTVADIINNIDFKNYQGVYNPQNNYSYVKGEIVWYGNYWWERVTEGSSKPGESHGWKKLTSSYSSLYTDGLYSSYEKNDIVIYNNKYYIAKNDIGYCDATWNLPYSQTTDWKELGSVNDPDVVKKVKNREYGNTYDKKEIVSNEIPRREDTVLNQYFSNVNDLKDKDKKNYEEYSDDLTYKDGDIVKKIDEVDPNFYSLWIKKAQFNVRKAPGTPDSGWIKLDKKWCQYSSYLKGNIVFAESGIGYICAEQDIFEFNGNLKEDVWTKNIWKRL